MPRNKEKIAVIDVEIMLDIKNNFKKLADFYKFSGLQITKSTFYQVLSQEECHPEDVQKVELGLNKALAVRDMAIGEMVDKVCKMKVKQQVTTEVEYALRVLCGHL